MTVAAGFRLTRYSIALVDEEGPTSRRTMLAAALAHGRPVVATDGPNRWDAPVTEGAIVLVAWLSRLTHAAGDRDASQGELPSIDPAIIGVTALAVLVPILVGFSVLVQSVLIGRYGLPAIAALAAWRLTSSS